MAISALGAGTAASLSVNKRVQWRNPKSTIALYVIAALSVLAGLYLSLTEDYIAIYLSSTRITADDYNWIWLALGLGSAVVAASIGYVVALVYNCWLQLAKLAEATANAREG